MSKRLASSTFALALRRDPGGGPIKRLRPTAPIIGVVLFALATSDARAEDVPVDIFHSTPRLTALTASLDAPDGPVEVLFALDYDDKGKLFSLDGASTVDGLTVSVTGTVKTKTKSGEAKYVLKAKKTSPKITLTIKGTISPGQGPQGGATVKYAGPSGKFLKKNGAQIVQLTFEEAPTSRVDFSFDETDGAVTPGPGGLLTGTASLESGYEDTLPTAVDKLVAKLKKTKLTLVAIRAKNKVTFKGTWDGSVYRGKLKWKIPPDKGVDVDAVVPGFVIPPTTGSSPDGGAFELLATTDEIAPDVPDDRRFIEFRSPHIDAQGSATFYATTLDDDFNTHWGLFTDAPGQLTKVYTTDDTVPIPGNQTTTGLLNDVVAYAPGGDAIIRGSYQVAGPTFDLANGLWHVDRDTGGRCLVMSGEFGGVIDDSAIGETAGNVHPITQRCQSVALNDNGAVVIGVPQNIYGKPFAGVFAWHGGVDAFSLNELPIGGDDLAVGPDDRALVVGCFATTRFDVAAPGDIESFIMWGDPVPSSTPSFGQGPCCAPGCLDPAVSWSLACAPAGYLPDSYVVVVQTEPTVSPRVAVRGEYDAPAQFQEPGLWIGTDTSAPFCGALVTAWDPGDTSEALTLPPTASIAQGVGVDPLMFAPTNDLIASISWHDAGTMRKTIIRVGAINAAESGAVHLITDKDEAPLGRVYGYSATTGLVFSAGSALWRTPTSNASNTWIPIVEAGQEWKIAKGDVRTVSSFEASGVNESGEFVLRLTFQDGPFGETTGAVYRVRGKSFG